MNPIKKTFDAVTLGLALCASLLVSNVKAGTGFYFTPGVPTQVVGSTLGYAGNLNPSNNTATFTYIATNNGVISTNTAVAWPVGIAPSTSVTNVTPVYVTGKDVALQFTAQAMQTNGGTVVAQLGRSVQLPNTMPAGGVTNAAGTGLNIEWFGTITNVLPANTATSLNSQISLFGPTLNQGSAGDGAITTFYVGWITTPANVTLTNYSIWAASQ